ncbi:MAG: phosphatidylserine decarboxylase, partial [Gammaproteobacteria bacterium]
GAELGHFNIGSTVILLFPEHTMQWLMHLRPGQQVRMGEAIGRLKISKL